MRFNLRRNLYLKLFSLLLAIACWFVVVPHREVRGQSTHLCDPISEPST